MADENSVPRHMSVVNRSWGLGVIKSAYRDTNPNAPSFVINRNAQDLEQRMFNSAKCPNDYRNSILMAVDSIRVLSSSSTGNVPESNPVRNRTIEDSSPNISSVAQGLTKRISPSQSTTQNLESMPDASDVIKLVPVILQAGAEVLGRIERAEQVRTITESQKSTIGFLALRKLSQINRSDARALTRAGASSASTHKTLDELLAGLPEAVNLQNLDNRSNCTLLRGSVRESRRGVRNEQIVRNDLQQARMNAGRTQVLPPITLAELKKKYGIQMTALLPLLEEKLREVPPERGYPNRTQIHEAIAYIRTVLRQKDLKAIDALRSAESTILRVLNNFGYLLNDVSNGNPIPSYHAFGPEKLTAGQEGLRIRRKVARKTLPPSRPRYNRYETACMSATSPIGETLFHTTKEEDEIAQDYENSHIGRYIADEGNNDPEDEDLNANQGETDSETDDDEMAVKRPKQGVIVIMDSSEHGTDELEENDSEDNIGEARAHITDEDESGYAPGTDEADHGSVRNESLRQPVGNISLNEPTDDEPNDDPKHEHAYEHVYEPDSEQPADESTTEMEAIVRKRSVVKKEPVTENESAIVSVQTSSEAEHTNKGNLHCNSTKEEDALAVNEDASVPMFTPRRSQRIRSRSCTLSTQVGAGSSSIPSATPQSARGTPAKSLHAKNTCRKTPGKTPKKTPKRTPRETLS